MKSIKLNKNIIYNLIIIVLVVYIVSFRSKQEYKVVVPSQENTMISENPIAEARYDTIIYKDSINELEVLKVVEVENPVNRELFAEYEEAVRNNDSLRQVILYKEAVTERKYKEIYEDSVQVITVKSEVIGLLKCQVVNYKTKPQILNVYTPVSKFSSMPDMFFGGFVYDLIGEPAIGANLSLLNNKKNRLYSIGFDSKKRVHFGVAYKLF